ncbi:MAG: DUF4297 domain-containing protein [Homoserinimonas sp.]|nr:DUF4297 domain-containing protein [Homoserinimonas sp.]MCW5944908.1 hypothetical protein [Cryobacterium sp.]
MGDSLAVTPSEDAGRDTASWYRFQYSITVLECILILSAGSGSVVVEHHTDYIRRGAPHEPDELVSVKHRTSDMGVWSIATLTTKALATLYKRWRDLGARDRCTVVTNGGLKTGAGELRELSEALVLSDQTLLQPFAERMAARLNATIAEAAEFLRVLSVKTVGADETAIGGHVITSYCRPTLLKLGVSPLHSQRVFDALFALVYEAASGLNDDEPDTWTPTESWPEQLLASRTISYTDLCDALAHLGISFDAVAAAARHTNTTPGTVLVRKLKRGGLGPSVEQGAPGLRARWYALESQYGEDIPIGSADEIHRLRRIVLNKAMLAESQARTTAQYGPAMHIALDRALSDDRVRTNLPIDQIDLMGCAYQLTDECLVWWSEPFDLLADEGDADE